MGAKRKFPTYAPETVKRMRTAQGAHARANVPRAKARGNIQKIGSYAGQLIASKPVGVPKVAARIRQRVFGNSGTATDKAWLFGSTMGPEAYFCRLAAQGIITHLLRECKDYRSDKGSQVTGSIFRYEVQFSPSDAQNGTGLARKMVMTLDADTSFNGMVDNPLGASGNSMTVDDVDVSVVDERNLVAQLFLQAVDGYYPTGLAANRDSFVSDSYVYRDTQFGKAQIAMNIKSDFKFQNITPATEAGQAFNVNAIDANPLQGKIATFRNLNLKWNQGWLQQQAEEDVNTLTNFSGRPTALSSWDYPQTSFNPFTTVTAEQAAMPLRMRTVFANAKTSTAVYLPPGGFKVFKTGFSFKGSIYQFMRDTTQQPNTGKYPPLGDSFALCLVPTMKSVVDEPVKVAFDYHRDGQCHIIKYRGGTLPTTNDIQ